MCWWEEGEGVVVGGRGCSGGRKGMVWWWEKRVCADGRRERVCWLEEVVY